MGSLMAGWDSSVLGDENSVRARRNRSLTKEEVEAFWKQRRNSGDGGEVTDCTTLQESPFGSLEKQARSPASPLSARGAKAKTGPSSPVSRVEVFPGDGNGDGAGGENPSPSGSRDWWTRSSWAFLNEPPQEEASGRAQSYAPQFHVARIAATGGGNAA